MTDWIFGFHHFGTDQLLPHPLSKPHANRPEGLDSQISLSIQSQIRPLGMLSGEASLSANARFLICGMRDNLKLYEWPFTASFGGMTGRVT